MKKPLLLLLVCVAAFSATGCWVSHTTDDRPELRAEIGKKGTLTGVTVLFRDRGGRLHLEEGDIPANATLIGRLPKGAQFEIKDVIYRISEPGRRDYYVIEVATGGSRFTVEVPVEERARSKWTYE